MSESRLLEAVSEYAAAYLPSLADRPIGPTASHEELVEALGGPLADAGSDDLEVIAALIRDGEAGVNAMPSGRFFGFVLGGSHPAALAADWLTSVWDQNAGLYGPAPTAAIVEEIAIEWLRELLGLPAGTRNLSRRSTAPRACLGGLGRGGGRAGRSTRNSRDRRRRGARDRPSGA